MGDEWLLHFTPMSASWMNMIERFFCDLSQQAILPGSFGSVAELVDTINRYLSQHNLDPKRYVWHADGQEVLAKSTERGRPPQSCNILKRFTRQYTSKKRMQWKPRIDSNERTPERVLEEEVKRYVASAKRTPW
jgi:hypothetical protein